MGQVTAKQAIKTARKVIERARKVALKRVPAAMKRIERQIRQESLKGRLETVVVISSPLIYEPISSTLSRRGFKCYYRGSTRLQVSWQYEKE